MISDQTLREIDFVMFVLYRVAEHLDMPVAHVYKLLNSVDIVDGYLIPCYNVLHTLGAEYLVEDVCGLACERGLQP